MSVNLDRHILAVIEPSIMPTDIELQSFGEEGAGPKQTKVIGIAYPYVTINKYEFSRTDIKAFTLTLSGQVPQLRITIEDNKNNFSIDSFPRDGDVITFLLNSKNESTFKSVHMDFDITSVTSIPSNDDELTTYVFTGKAKIPMLDTEECRHYELGTSLDHLEQEAKYLGLGLATNVGDPADSQIRIQAYSSHAKFINEIVQSSYISEESFQTSFIDQYYYLNYIDVNKVFNSPNMTLGDMEDTVSSFNGSAQSEDPDVTTVESDSIPMKLLLTNHFEFKSTNQYLERWGLENNSSSVVSSHGHFRDVQVYDNNGTEESKLQEFRLDPLTSDNLLDNEEPLRGRRDEDRYLNQLKHKYSGRQDVGEDGLGNVHANHVYAKLHNHRNVIEAGKMKMKITLGSFNPGLYKYQKVPVLIYHFQSNRVANEVVKDHMAKELGFDDKPFEFNQEIENTELPKMALDSFMSGNYVISNIDYTYSLDEGLKQELTLLRREWPTSLGEL